MTGRVGLVIVPNPKTLAGHAPAVPDPMIDVEPMDDDDPMAFRVSVEEGGSTTQHVVTMARGTYDELTGGKVDPTRTIQGAFEFLLDREPKEQILDRFDVTVISKYFPEFEEELGGYLG